MMIVKLVFTGIPILVALGLEESALTVIQIFRLNAETSRFLGSKYNGKKIFEKEGQNLNLTWKYEIQYLPKVMEFFFGEWKDPGFVSKTCFKVDENGKVLKTKSCEDKYGYKGDGSNGTYKSNVVIYNLTKSDMEKKYGIDIEMGVYSSPLNDWFELRTLVKAKITHFFISRNTAVKEGDAVNITCRATGGPEPNVTLYKQDKTIKEGKGDVVHKIHKTAMHHAGDYVCVASNDEGEVPDRRRITLSVEGTTSRSAANKCFSEPWILGFLLFSRWI